MTINHTIPLNQNSFLLTGFLGQRYVAGCSQCQRVKCLPPSLRRNTPSSQYKRDAQQIQIQYAECLTEVTVRSSHAPQVFQYYSECLQILQQQQCQPSAKRLQKCSHSWKINKGCLLQIDSVVGKHTTNPFCKH